MSCSWKRNRPHGNGQKVRDGRKQRLTIDKDSESSATISKEALMIIADIAAIERRKSATIESPGAYLRTDLRDETIIVKFEGRMQSFWKWSTWRPTAATWPWKSGRKYCTPDWQRCGTPHRGAHYQSGRRYMRSWFGVAWRLARSTGAWQKGSHLRDGRRARAGRQWPQWRPCDGVSTDDHHVTRRRIHYHPS